MLGGVFTLLIDTRWGQSPSPGAPGRQYT